MEPKRQQIRHQKNIKILIDFWTDFGPNLEPNGRPKGNQNDTQIDQNEVENLNVFWMEK